MLGDQRQPGTDIRQAVSVHCNERDRRGYLHTCMPILLGCKKGTLWVEGPRNHQQPACPLSKRKSSGWKVQGPTSNQPLPSNPKRKRTSEANLPGLKVLTCMTRLPSLSSEFLFRPRAEEKLGNQSPWPKSFDVYNSSTQLVFRISLPTQRGRETRKPIPLA